LIVMLCALQQNLSHLLLPPVPCCLIYPCTRGHHSGCTKCPVCTSPSGQATKSRCTTTQCAHLALCLASAWPAAACTARAAAGMTCTQQYSRPSGELHTACTRGSTVCAAGRDVQLQLLHLSLSQYASSSYNSLVLCCSYGPGTSLACTQ
jgi:hypothetical protein